MKTYKIILAGLLTLLSFQVAASNCATGVINPITDISWQCVFPIKLGGIEIGSDIAQTNPDAVKDSYEETKASRESSPGVLCSCKKGSVVEAGIGLTLWEPSRIIDTVSDPYCMMPLGIKMMSTGGKLGGSLDNNGGQGKAFQQLHYYIFPTWNILGFFYDIPCIAERTFDVALITEVLPTWQNEILALLVNPEAILFANPVSSLACAADSAAALIGRPLNALFWCMGSWGNAYPLAGSITSTDYVAANAGIAAKGIYLMARLGLLQERSNNGCYSAKALIWSKDKYKLQLMKPVRDNSCRPIGQTGLLWSHYKHPPAGGDNFSWMVFRRINCCASF